MFNLFRHCRKDEISFDIVAKNGNNVEATFDTVERIVQLVAFDNVASTLLLVWTGLNARVTYVLCKNFGRSENATLVKWCQLLHEVVQRLV